MTRPPSVDKIISRICLESGLSKEEILGTGKKRSLVSQRYRLYHELISHSKNNKKYTVSNISRWIGKPKSSISVGSKSYEDTLRDL